MIIYFVSSAEFKRDCPALITADETYYRKAKGYRQILLLKDYHP